MVVVAVIGILVVGIVGILDPKSQLEKTRDARRKSDLKQIQNALEVYYSDFGRYPYTGLPGGYYIKSEDGTVLAWGSVGWKYMGTLPKDPSSNRKYVYYSNDATDNQSYYLYASLEREGKDSQACFSSGAACPSTITTGVPEKQCDDVDGTTFICNYGVTSSNVSP